MDYRDNSNCHYQGGQFWTLIRGQFSGPIDTLTPKFCATSRHERPEITAAATRSRRSFEYGLAIAPSSTTTWLNQSSDQKGIPFRFNQSEIDPRLRATSPGRPGWQAFESACYEAIRHLFGRELHNLLTQHRTDDGLNRMDLIGRIRSGQQSFWAMIASDFSTRYIVFDAKNYVAPIDQDAVHTTAKYLMHRALRTFAIIIARDGASPQAMQVAAGGLREDGKFILVISMADVCSMLEGDDRGDPPENRLFEKLDEVLMSLGR